MTITERLMQLDPTLVLHNEGEWSKTILSYSAFNDGGVECEVGEFLYGMVRILKPKGVLETGTHYGIGAAYMLLALDDNATLDDNEFGYLNTIEFQKENRDIAYKRLFKVSGKFRSHLMDVKDYTPVRNFQLILLDTEPDIRFKELIKFYPYLDEGGYVFIHDTPRNLCQGNVNPDHPHLKSWPFGDLPEEIKQWVKEDKLRPFHFPSPRGLIGLYKTHRDDYVWKKE